MPQRHGHDRGGTSATSPADLFSYDSIPTATSLAPNVGPLAGGTAVTVSGSGFTAGSTVSFGGTSAASVTVTNATTLIATSPGGTGAVDLTVTTPGGTSAVSSADVFAYDAAPTVTSLTPSAGPLVGGTVVMVTGTGFTAGSSVVFGSASAGSVSVTNATTLVATSPAGTGSVDVTVTTAGGTSVASAPDLFTYRVVPTLTVITPVLGPLAGGTVVTVTGSGFTAGSAVAFGSTPTTSVTVINATSLTAISPAASSGQVDVTVATAGGTTATSPADVFTYVGTPSVTSVAPNFGPPAGGTVVTVTGTGFTAGSTVAFGSAGAAISTTVTNTTTLTATSPAAAVGAVDLTVTTVGGTSATDAADLFTYSVSADVPTVGITPTSIPVTAGPVTYTVTVTGTGPIPTGSVALADGQGGTCTINSLTAGSGSCSMTENAASSPYTVTAHYSGDVTYASATATLYISTSVASGGSASSGSDGVTATATGSTNNGVDTVTETQYSSTPVGPITVGVNYNYFDVVDSTGNTFAAVGIADCSGVTESTVMQWWDPTANGGAGGWAIVMSPATDTTAPFGQTYSDVAGLQCISVTLSPNSSPTLAQITGTVFGTSNYPPTISTISPTIGPATGGTSVTIGGSYLAAATVTVGGAAATVTADTASSLTFTTPAGTAGSAPVVVTTVGGPSSSSFTYVAKPTVTGLSPSQGPLVGGTAVTISGTGFAAGSVVDFGATPATASP